jgi:hypothetical protein
MGQNEARISDLKNVDISDLTVEWAPVIDNPILEIHDSKQSNIPRAFNS